MGGIDPTKESANPEVLTTEVSYKNTVYSIHHIEYSIDGATV